MGTVAIDMCCGMGGLSLAAKSVGIQPIAGVDINKNALKTYQKNFPDTKTIEGDVTKKAVWEQCKEISESYKSKESKVMILTGPPCQGFSIAGSRDPKDPRNNVLLSIAKAICYIHPYAAMVENVASLLSDRNKESIQKFNNILTRTNNYKILPIILDASDFGVPQKRKRVFFLISTNNINEKDLSINLNLYRTEKIAAQKAFIGLPQPEIRPDNYDDERFLRTIANHEAMNHSKKVISKISKIKPGEGPLSYKRLNPTKPSVTLISGHRAPPVHPSEHRSITVREAARLQGFPDSFRVYGYFYSQMEQVTNAVPYPLGKSIINAFFQCLGE